uniref:Transposase n=1 Tax=Rodentolepis nana TaxID=102285 RepID=A0A0R3TY03_RODNA
REEKFPCWIEDKRHHHRQSAIPIERFVRTDKRHELEKYLSPGECNWDQLPGQEDKDWYLKLQSEHWHAIVDSSG